MLGSVKSFSGISVGFETKWSSPNIGSINESMPVSQEPEIQFFASGYAKPNTSAISQIVILFPTLFSN